MSGLLQIHISVFLFGLSGLFAKFLLLPASLIVLGRTFFASLALIALLLKRRERISPVFRNDAPFFGLGVLLAVHWFSFFYSIQISSIAIGLLTFSSFPMFVCFLEPLVEKKNLSRKDLFFSTIVIAGLALVVPNYDLGDQTTIGAIWGIFSGFTFAVLQIFNRKYVGSNSPARMSLYENAAACLVLTLFSGGQISILTGYDLALLAVLGLFCTALAHTLFISGLISVRAQLASLIAALEPVYGILLAAMFFGEMPSARTLIGGIIILGTVVFSSRQVS